MLSYVDFNCNCVQQKQTALFVRHLVVGGIRGREEGL